MPQTDDLHLLARQIIQAQDSCTPLSAFSSSGHKLSMHQAYQVSWIVHEERLKAGWKPIGRKIGFTNPDMWALYGVHQPVWAFVYDRTYVEISATVGYRLADLCQPKIEPEIALCLLHAPAVGATEDELIDCVEWVAHGIEMVQCHYPDWKFTSTDAVCDSSFHGKLLLGRKRFVQTERAHIGALLRNCAVSLYRGDELVEVGYGRNVLGSPLLALSSLVEAIQLEGAGYPLQPGEIITTGTMTKAYAVSAGECWRSQFEQGEFPAMRIDFF